MGITRAVSTLVPSDKITVYFATTNERVDNILSWGFREGVRLRITNLASQPGKYESTESCIEITLPESVIAKYEQWPVFIRYECDNRPDPLPMLHAWIVPTEILNSYPKVRLD